MLTDEQCRAYVEECKRLASAPDISARRATVLRTMIRSWTMLENATGRYEATVRDERKPS
jgi:hypothetical protein